MEDGDARWVVRCRVQDVRKVLGRVDGRVAAEVFSGAVGFRWTFGRNQELGFSMRDMEPGRDFRKAMK